MKNFQKLSNKILNFFKKYLNKEILIKNKKNILIYSSLFILGIIFGFTLYKLLFDNAKKTPQYYYSIIENQENILEGVSITEQDLKEIKRCENQEFTYESGRQDCFRAIYKKITLKLGPEKSFSHMALLQKEHPELLESCHYMSHGIGHGALQLYKNDVAKAYNIMNSNDYFKNVATCGNGYFHGVIEEFAKNIYDKDKLAEKLKPVCSLVKEGNCSHGVGHAAIIQLDYNLDDALYVCENLSNSKIEKFSCYTGAFMEYAGLVPMISVSNGIMNFDTCDKYQGMKRHACYLETSSFYEHYTEDWRNYTRNVGFCKQIKDEVDRMACVKLFAIRAVRIVRFTDVKNMCANTSNNYEKVMCTAIMGDRIGRSIDKTTKKEIYSQALNDTCKTLNPILTERCMTLVDKESYRLFYTSAEDLSFKSLDQKIMQKYKEKFLNIFKI